MHEGVCVRCNFQPHEAKRTVEAVEQVVARILPLPQWNPDTSPIEEMFSKFKALLRSTAA